MRILLLHNRYKQRGGEDAAVRAEASLLSNHGHEVLVWELSNDAIHFTSSVGNAALAATAVWSGASYRTIRRELRRFRPHILHCHNTFPLLSPAVYYAAQAESTTVVQTLHNYRLLCVNALLFRNGAPCEVCVGHTPVAGVIHRCYRGSRLASAAVCAMLVAHRLAGTWARRVHCYIALSEFARSRFLAAGLPSDRLTVKPNSVDQDPGLGNHDGGFALFVGRLSKEKGIETLLDAWRMIGRRVPLRMVGDGPMRPDVERAALDSSGIAYLGAASRPDVLELMKRAAFLVLPSLCYENSPMVLAEAFATGLPAIVTAHGALPESIESGRLGWSFPPGDSGKLSSLATRIHSQPRELTSKGSAAREAFERRLSPEVGYRALMAIYAAAAKREDVSEATSTGTSEGTH